MDKEKSEETEDKKCTVFDDHFANVLFGVTAIPTYDALDQLLIVISNAIFFNYIALFTIADTTPKNIGITNAIYFVIVILSLRSTFDDVLSVN